MTAPRGIFRETAAGLRWAGPSGLALIAAATLYVAWINGGPLYYYDTGGYFHAGLKVLYQFGLISSDGSAQTAGQLAADGDVNASRSIVFAVFTTVLSLYGSPSVVPYVQSAILFAALWLVIAVPLRGIGTHAQPLPVLTVSVVAAALGSLPFYVAFVMPDILSGPLILLAGLVTCFGHLMRRGELVVAYLIAAFAVTAHPSHLPLAAGLLGLAFLGAYPQGRAAVIRAVAFMGLVLATGGFERIAFQAAAKQVLGAEVYYYPFLTARLIADGVGYDYLVEVCPDAELDTCLLYEALSASDDPMRLTPSHIIFESSPELGSLRRLEGDNQMKVAAEQIEFARRTLFAHPVATLGALARNTFKQAGMYSVEMSVPSAEIVEGLRNVPRIGAELEGGRLTLDRGWIETADRIHTAVYLVSVVALAVLVIWPGLLGRDARIFAAIVILGILGNALICGGISQPANRYGARVIWLLPFTAAFLAMIAVKSRRSEPAE